MKRLNDLFQKRQYMIAPDYELFHYSDPANLSVHPHTHDFYEIYYLLSDHIEVIIGNQSYHVQRGDFLLIAPGLLHYPCKLSVKEGASYERFVLWCSPAYFDSFVTYDNDINHMWDAVVKNSSYHIRPSAAASHMLRSLFLHLLNEQHSLGCASKTMVRSLLGQIFVTMNRTIFESEHFVKHSPTQTLFNNILYYIHTHLTEDLSLEILSQHFFVSKGYISRIFKEQLNITVYQYILALRLDAVKKAIAKGIPATKAAENLGFSEYSCFYRNFKKAFGVSPKQYQDSISSKAEALTVID